MLSFFKGGTDTEKPANGKGKLWILLIAAALGVVLILIGGITGEETQKETQTEHRTQTEEIATYRKQLEARIKSLCESVDGVSNVTVAVTLSGGFESVYATEWKDGNEEYVILGSGSSASALYLSHSVPEVAGIGIVCRGGESTHIRNELIALLSATFRVNSNRIYIAEGKG
ncbi:MAG: hypothetical protein E7643_05405 [Ruminococcaceae bacterium]|nr:hypothetical protein [Oscillospiraceae bacterium]